MDDKIKKELKDWAEALCSYIPYFESIQGMEGCGWFLNEQPWRRTTCQFYRSEHYKLRDFYDSFYFGLFLDIGLDPENFHGITEGLGIQKGKMKEIIEQADLETVLEIIDFYYLERFSDYFSSKGTKDGIILMSLYRLRELINKDEISLSGKYLHNIRQSNFGSVHRYKYSVMEDRSSPEYYKVCTEKLCFYIPFFESVKGMVPPEQYPRRCAGSTPEPLPYMIYDETLCEFSKLMEDTGFQDFEYFFILEFRGTTEELLELIMTSDAETSRAMLAFYYRWERFDKGLWKAGAYNGTILAALYRLRELFQG